MKNIKLFGGGCTLEPTVGSLSLCVVSSRLALFCSFASVLFPLPSRAQVPVFEITPVDSTIQFDVEASAKLNHLAYLRIGEYVALIAAADEAGHYGVSVLLESCLADKLAFVERTRRLIRNVVETETKIANERAGAPT